MYAVRPTFSVAGLIITAKRVQHRRFVRPGRSIARVERQRAVTGQERLIVATERGQHPDARKLDAIGGSGLDIVRGGIFEREVDG